MIMTSVRATGGELRLITWDAAGHASEPVFIPDCIQHGTAERGQFMQLQGKSTTERSQNMKRLLSRQLCVIFGLLLLSLSPYADAQARAGSERDLKARRTEFLKPLNPQFILSPNDPLLPQFCARLGRSERDVRCPPIVSNGRVSGGIPQLELGLKARLPNVRVSLFIQEISNEVVANGGVETEYSENGGGVETVQWNTAGPEADAEEGGTHGWRLLGPGQTEVLDLV